MNIAISTVYQVLLIVLPLITAPYIARVIGPELAKKITQIFLTTDFEGGRHARRVGMIDTLDQGGTLND